MAGLTRLTFHLRSHARLKHTLDRSLVPTISENDLEETFVCGSGPGGSAVNKNSNCVVLKHKPSGIVIKCHMSRDLQDNRKGARKLLVSKLDDLINGEKSISKQILTHEEKKSRETDRKRRKLQLLKEEWKKREGFVDDK